MNKQDMEKILEGMEKPAPDTGDHQFVLERALLESGYIGKKAGFWEKLKHMKLSKVLYAGGAAFAAMLIVVTGLTYLGADQNSGQLLGEDPKPGSGHQAIDAPEQEPEKKYGYFDIPELGIRIKTPEGLEDQLVYSIQEYRRPEDNSILKAASFSSKILMNATKNNPDGYAPSCNAQDGPLGSISITAKLIKVPAVWPDQGEEVDGLRWIDLGDLRKDDPYLIRYGGGYLRYEGPHSTCSTNVLVQELQSRQIRMMQEAFGTIEKMETI